MLDLASIIKLMEKKDGKQSIINIRFAWSNCTIGTFN
jgi:hypothetical protein